MTKPKNFQHYLLSYCNNSKRPLVCDIVVDDKWSKIRISSSYIRTGQLIITVYTYILNEWVFMGHYYTEGGQFTLLSPVHNPTENQYYKEQLLILFDSLTDKNVDNQHKIFVTALAYCKICGKPLCTYKSIVRGYGKSCEKYV